MKVGVPLTYLPTYLPTYLLTYLPTYLLTYPLTYLPTYLPTYLLTLTHKGRERDTNVDREAYIYMSVGTYLLTYLPHA